MLKALPPQIQHKLRSGIAISSYAQCVEELVLNAVDAESTCIAVRIDFLTKKIQVVDNGKGISREDLTKLAERYHTSKCGSLKDLENELQHYGYRGEALASIRSMCYMLDVESRSRSSPYTHCKIFRSAKPEDVFESKTPRPSTGTTVTVFDLFCNMPVRNKSMNETLELERIRQRMEGIALVHPRISLSLKNEATGVKILQTHKANSVVGVFTHLFGVSKSRHLCAIQGDHEGFTVQGFISKEGNSNKCLQFVFVNDRLVLKTKLHKLINTYMRKTMVLKKKGFYNRPDAPAKWSPGSSTEDVGPSKHTERHAIYVINVKCPLSAYDITFDPSKTLVEFKDWEGVLKCVQSAVKDMVEKEGLLFTSIPGQNLSPDIKALMSGNAEADSQDSQDNTDLDGNGENSTNKSNGDKSGSYGNAIATHDLSNSLQSKTVKRPATKCKNIKPMEKDENYVEDSPPILISESKEPIASSGETSPPILVPETLEEFENFDMNTSNEYVETDSEAVPGGALTKAYLQQKETMSRTVVPDSLDVVNIYDSQSISGLFTIDEEEHNQNTYSSMRYKALKFDQTSRKRRNKDRKDKQRNIKVKRYQSTQDVPSSLGEILQVSSECVSSEIDSEPSPRRRDKTFLSLSTQLSSPSTSSCSESRLSRVSHKQLHSKMLSPLQKVKQKYNLLYHKKYSSPKKGSTQMKKSLKPSHRRHMTATVYTHENKLKVKSETTRANEVSMQLDSTPEDLCQDKSSNIEGNEDPLALFPSYSKAMKKADNHLGHTSTGFVASDKNLNSETKELKTVEDIFDPSRKSLLSPLQRIRERLLEKSKTRTKVMSEWNDQEPNNEKQTFKKHSDISKHKKSPQYRMEKENSDTKLVGCTSAISYVCKDSAEVSSGNYTDCSKEPISALHLFDTPKTRHGNDIHIETTTGSISDNNKFVDNLDKSEKSKDCAFDNIKKLPTKGENVFGSVQTKTRPKGLLPLVSKLSRLSQSCQDCSEVNSKYSDLDKRIKHNSVYFSKQSCETVLPKTTNRLNTDDFMSSSNFMQTAEGYNFEEALKSLENSQESQEELEDKATSPGELGVNNIHRLPSKLECLAQSIESMCADIPDKYKDTKNSPDYSEHSPSHIENTNGTKCTNSESTNTIFSKDSDTVVSESDNIKKGQVLITKSLDYDIEYIPITDVSQVDSIGNLSMTDTQVKHLYPTYPSNDTDTSSTTPTSFHSEGFEVTSGEFDEIYAGSSRIDSESNGFTSVVIEPSQGFVPSCDAQFIPETQGFKPVIEESNFKDNDLPLQGITTTSINKTTADAKETTEGTTYVDPLLTEENKFSKTKDHNSDVDTIEDFGKNWICKVDRRTGEKLYINIVSGNSSLEPPILCDGNIKTKVIQSSHKAFLLTNNAAPYLDHPKARVVSKSSNQKLTGKLKELFDSHSKTQELEEEFVKWRSNSKSGGASKPDEEPSTSVTQLFDDWRNPMFQQPHSTVPSGEVGGLSRGAQLIQASLQPVRFDKDMLSNIQVLNQLDRKFITCIMKSEKESVTSDKETENLLVVVDQHAAHERIRLEQFTNDIYEKRSDGQRRLKRSRVTSALVVCTTEDTVRLMTAYTKYFSQIGVEFTVSSRDTVSIHTVPTCLIWEKDGSEPGRPRDTPFLLRQLQLLIREQVDVLEKTRGANVTLPKTIHSILCSRACHGAIKFGDALEHRDCEELIAQLKNCKLPFQCAHGRPSVMPLLNLNKVKSTQEKKLPRLWKLRDAMDT